MKLNQKIAVVTGGASGIGLATVRRLANAGAAVVIADLGEAAGKAAEEELDARGHPALFVRTDVSSLESVQALFTAAKDKFGGVDILFNNAGVLGGPRFPEAIPASWMKAIDVNLVGVLNCIHVGVPYLKERGEAIIVNTASTAGLKSSALDPAYAMTKAGVISLTRSLVFLQAEAGIRINAVCPALVKTPLESNSGANYDAEQLKAFRDGRAGRGDLPSLTPDDVAAAVMHLIEDDELNGYACTVVVGEPWAMIPPVQPQKV